MTSKSVRSESKQVEFPVPSADATGDASGGAGAGVGPAGVRGVKGSPEAVNSVVGAVNGATPEPAADTNAAAPATDGNGTALSDDQFTRVAKALADPRRFSILEIIAAHGEIACQRLCAELPVKQATVSHHVKELSAAGLVETRRDGQFVYYRYLPTVMRQYRETLAHRVAA